MTRYAEGRVLLMDRDGDGEGARPTLGPTTTSRTAGRTVAAIIGVNLVVQIVVFVIVVANGLDLVTAVRISLLTGVVFYAVTALAVRILGSSLDLRPRIGTEHPLLAVGEGIVVGLAAASLLSALLRLLFGQPLLDATSAGITVGGAGWLLAGILVVAVLAPLVEELVFRGFLLEAFRDRGPVPAILFSAIAFSLAHLRFLQFRYYLVMGAVFGLLYWRRGLIASISAHAAFNGMLLVVSVAGVHAPAVDVSAAGFTVALPATWSHVTAVHGDDLIAYGPLGARVELAHYDGPRPVLVDNLVRGLGDGSIPAPDGVGIDRTTVVAVNVPAGRGVTMAAQVDDRDGRLTMVPKGNRLWVALYRADGTDEGAAHFDDIVRSWHLP
ncbi:MAG TPA: CPBP family intramembrane glutamic endopeptidase [Acidimicrobiales bacterium]|nr:CPBP family intramembrane glutamic endopeptidase [Acidimicrobiales bacterium]